MKNCIVRAFGFLLAVANVYGQTNPCATNPCQNGGTCFSYKTTDFFCLCPSGVSGPKCNFHPCSGSPCQNGGVCLALYNKYTCTCPPSYVGATCGTRSPCLSNPCLNGGICTAFSASSYTCNCPSGYGGIKCECRTSYASKLLQCALTLHTAGLAATSGKGYCQLLMNYFCCVESSFVECPSVFESSLKTAMSFYDTISNSSLCGQPLRNVFAFEDTRCKHGIYKGEFPKLDSCDLGIIQYGASKCMGPVITRMTQRLNITCSDMKTGLCCARKQLGVCPAMQSALEPSILKSIKAIGGLNDQYKNCGFSMVGVLFGNGMCKDIWREVSTPWPISTSLDTYHSGTTSTPSPISRSSDFHPSGATRNRSGLTSGVIIFIQLLFSCGNMKH